MKRLVLLLSAIAIGGSGLAAPQPADELRFCLHGDPKTFDPFRAEDENSDTVRYLTTGVLIRLDRVTELLVPELATSWKVDMQGRRITFQLRRGVVYSDGAPFGSADVAYSLTRLFDPQLHSPIAEAFNNSTPPQIKVASPEAISITFGVPVAGLERLFDQVPIVSRDTDKRPSATLGPFSIAAYKPGIDVLLERNPKYFKLDRNGRRLPYVGRIRLIIQSSRDMEVLRYTRGELDLVNSLDPDIFEELSRRGSWPVLDAGPSLESEMMWFNQSPKAAMPAYKRAWFASQAFRQAVSESIRREDICRVVYKGHATPAAGVVSPANRFWRNTALKPRAHNVAAARARLEREGFQLRAGALYDRTGHPVEFSLITNAGNQSRARIAAMIQQDLQALGVRVNVTTLDFPSLIERITRNLNYEACLLGLTNVDLDPNAQMNVWISSAANHQWNPNQTSPATQWEAEIDRLMRAQAAELRPEERKRLFDRVQQIVWEQEPFIYLVHKNSLMAFGPQIQNRAPSVLQPHTFWNIEFLQKNSVLRGSR